MCFKCTTESILFHKGKGFLVETELSPFSDDDDDDTVVVWV